MGRPRRTVVDAHQLHNRVWENTWVATLSCGHRINAIGRKTDDEGMPIIQMKPPKTAGCWKCEDERNKGATP